MTDTPRRWDRLTAEWAELIGGSLSVELIRRTTTAKYNYRRNPGKAL